MMNTFPLVRTRWSNEHIMAGVFTVLVLYMVPLWVQNPTAIGGFLAVLTAAMFIDVIANFIRYKKPTCAVSAAVTAAMLEVLTPGVPLWGRLLGIAFALLAGKHFWGGTGKNAINPAITGLVLLSLLFDVGFPAFTPTFLLLPAVLLSLPFIKFRLFSAAGFMTGMVLALMFTGGISIFNIAAYGVVFWGCLVVTDPVTVTPHPVIGAAAGLLCGFIPLGFFGTAISMALGVIVLNIISFAAEGVLANSKCMMHSQLKIKRVIPFIKEKAGLLDLAGREKEKIYEYGALSRDGILKCIEEKQVFGFGGAAFPAHEKIRTVIESGAVHKHLIINGVECDPGLIHDKWLLRRYPNEIYKGIEILRSCVEYESVTLAVKDTEGLSYPQDLKILKVPDFYPAGAEKVLIREVLGKTLPYKEIPAREGILVLNVQTVFSIYEAVCKNKKADSRFLTAASLKEKTGMVVRVKLGAGIHDVVKGVYPQFTYAFIGGGLMQSRIATDEDVVDKSVNFLAVGDFPRFKDSPLCSRCGLCTASCPAGLMVKEIAQLVDDGNLKETGRFHAEECMNCGTCSFVCLAGRNLSSRMKAAKEYLKV